MRKFILTLGILMLALQSAALAADDDIRFESRAEIEVPQINEKGETVYIREPAKQVTPNSVVIFTNSFTNQSNRPAESIKVTNPVPQNMVYIPGSALGENSLITFSVDSGVTFAKESDLTVTSDDGSEQPAEPKDITHIHWLITSPLPAGETGFVEFRARLL